MAKDLRGNKGNGNFNNNNNNLNLNTESVKKYANKSEQELMAELMKSAGESRKNGNLSDADLDNLVTQMRGNMTPEQFAKLQRLTGMLKNNKG